MSKQKKNDVLKEHKMFWSFSLSHLIVLITSFSPECVMKLYFERVSS